MSGNRPFPPGSDPNEVDVDQFEPSVHWRNRDAPSTPDEDPSDPEGPAPADTTIGAPAEASTPMHGPNVSLEGPPLTLTSLAAPARWATRGVFASTSWPEIIERLRKPELWPGQGSIESSRSRLSGWTFAEYRDHSRVVMRDRELAARETAARVERVHGLAVEYEDEPTVDADHIERWWGDHCFVAHTTGFNEQEMGERPPGPRWRVLVPLSRPVSLEDAIRLAAWARHPRHAVGMVATSTAEAWRYYDAPAIAPGGYRWTAKPGPLLDPDMAMEQLAGWQLADVAHRAREALVGTSLAECTARFRDRHDADARHPFFSLPGGPPTVPTVSDAALIPTASPGAWSALTALSGGIWPGRVVSLAGASGAGRSALALQLAEAAATAGQPVLLVLTRSGTDAAVARLLALRAAGDSASLHGVPAWALLQGAGSDAGLLAATQAMEARLPGLHLWAPTWQTRTIDELARRVRATSDAHDSRPPLVIVDAVEGWATEADPVRETRILAAALRDLAHPGAIDAVWPGAGVVLVCAASADAGALLRDAASLERASAARSLAGALGPVADDASSSWVLATDPPGPQPWSPRRASVAVARNREGPTGVVSLVFEPVPGRFRT